MITKNTITNDADAMSSTTTASTFAAKEKLNKVSLNKEDISSLLITCSLEDSLKKKPQKSLTIYNSAAYLTTPHKPKMQVINQAKLKDICAIGMVLLESNPDRTEAEEMKECRSNAAGQAEFKSPKEFPQVNAFIKDCLGSDIDSLPCVAWFHPILVALLDQQRDLHEW